MGNNPSILAKLIQTLKKQFPIKDLGSFHQFLSIELAPAPSDLVLSQIQYILDVLTKAGLTDCKPAPPLFLLNLLHLFPLKLSIIPSFFGPWLVHCITSL